MRRALVLGLLVLAGCGGSKPQLAGTPVDPPAAAPNFRLEDQYGKPVSPAGQRGRWLVVTFLYTHCPDVCPLIAAQLDKAIATPTGRKAQLHVIAVSVDPVRDTPAAVRRYTVTHRLEPTFRWGIGSRTQLERVWHAYHVAAQPGPGGTVTHSTFEILVDPDGKERVIYDQSIKAAQLTGDLQKLGV